LPVGTNHSMIAKRGLSDNCRVQGLSIHATDELTATVT
jgi:hypothetical protein